MTARNLSEARHAESAWIIVAMVVCIAVGSFIAGLNIGQIGEHDNEAHVAQKDDSPAAEKLADEFALSCVLNREVSAENRAKEEYRPRAENAERGAEDELPHAAVSEGNRAKPSSDSENNSDKGFHANPPRPLNTGRTGEPQ